VPHAGNADVSFGDAVDHDVRGKAGNHQLTCSRLASDPAQVRLVGQPFNGGYNRIADALGGVRVVGRNYRRRAPLKRAVQDWPSEYALRALLPCVSNDGVQFRDHLGVVNHIAGFLGPDAFLDRFEKRLFT
jgi:hypothetical protein